MRKYLGIGAVVLGVVGVLLSATVIGIGWWATVKITGRLDRANSRLDQGMSKIEVRLARVEARVNSLRTDLNTVHASVDSIAADNPELPRIRAEIERLLNRLIPAIERTDDLADSLLSVAAGLRTTADIVDQIKDNATITVRVQNAADKIDRAAETLNGIRARVEALKSAKSVQLMNGIVTLSREAITSSELLSEGIASVREVIAIVPGQTGTWRDTIVFWIYIAMTAITVIFLCSGLGQLCLIGWGRKTISHR
jgi:archaellum component FlaC